MEKAKHTPTPWRAFKNDIVGPPQGQRAGALDKVRRVLAKLEGGAG